VLTDNFEFGAVFVGGNILVQLENEYHIEFYLSHRLEIFTLNANAFLTPSTSIINRVFALPCHLELYCIG
jgi:hypothetical protein